MNVAQLSEFGDAEVLDLAEAPMPEPGPGQLLLRLVAASVNRSDILLRSGRYNTLPVLPATPGIEGAGVVAALGDDLDGFRVGDRVVAWGPSGFYAEYALADATRTVPVPDRVPLTTAAALPVAWLTARASLRELGGLRAGQSVLIHAAASGVGTAAVQTAKTDGATVIAVVGSDEKAALARELGADHVLRRDRDDLVEQTKRLTAGRGVDLVLDLVGGAAFPVSLRLAAAGGRVVVVANVAGEAGTIDTRDFYPRNISIHGFQFTNRQTLGWDPRPDLSTLLAEIADGVYRVIIDNELPLADAAQAHRLIEDNVTRGKVILAITDE
ncbi:quinone oxidoreductase family protein [Agromyces bauzanensis]|uniref:Quinone oxidoreductase n=1 Tax=Agromyces bauzanensis TaxID=1308924 RepID=A0A917PKU1_9MICO|nr:zinc-binding dehydrogenase [Agromyces bauzanensis]GGJ83278.1 quinone oxidoreductase [Agromyces bauzanensis]